MQKNVVGTKEHEAVKVNFFRRIGLKFTAAIAVAALLASVFCMSMTIPNSIEMVGTITQNEMQSLIRKEIILRNLFRNFKGIKNRGC